ncbi:cell envelope biogenesis protein OmpA [Pseudomonas sp. FW306-02-F02-AA]|jgi:outer membrane protein OmpA-like peptidoglycan-associated protein|uniref:Cell envelope biogenesis protein OmpA n=1 Tax=Pseudomonas fluorescens TaxID=294 RepID=A0A0N9WDF4_PSEFL|nr:MULTISPECIES: OmpA family protein [Pseudomonas]ALI02351.1 cell envelope biogenesis protein OmpA [Pseudomonas fluorescens]PMZ03824.1 cell envelope biogenesis protein OmpA [Pseudomonas sp. FW306-02-F02-AB]PMZ10529.1 cell envelope biogenesis protein OmpA [Pseudomonas sp. FW306-02-H06C]PMZ15465.1 cell envelope biogenesis protein OmpA [Pseudomonas sp. FW306-02-F02-AA]PMZ22763.1 cell envelope biogenesis protein OmpA [Pseudomonas sp. FW306-02-F08-AA]
MFTSSRLIIVATAVAMLAGCANQNPYDNQGQADSGSTGMSKTAKYGGLGALAGALAGAAIDHNNRGKGALIGAAVVGASAAGYGYYADQQEKKLRASMANTGVEVQRQGDQIKLIMPGNITFGTDSANIAPSFYQPLNNLAGSLKEFNQNQIEIVGYTDSTGSRQHNMDLSQRRAQSVATYLTSQGVSGANLSARGAGPDNPIASNGDVNGRAQNRRVEVNLKAIPGQQYGQPAQQQGQQYQ